MDAERVRTSAFAIPLTNPSYLPGHYRFVDRQYLIITYRSDPEAIGRVLPEPLEVTGPLVHCEFIRMPDTTGFGDYTRGQVIPVRFRGVDGSYSHATYVNDEVPIAGGRELWGFPKKLADPSLTVDKDRYNGTIHDLVMLNALADTPAAKGAIQQATSGRLCIEATPDCEEILATTPGSPFASVLPTVGGAVLMTVRRMVQHKGRPRSWP